jgi:hypothetical protein
VGTPSGLPLKAMPGFLSFVSDRIIAGYLDASVYSSGSPLFNQQGELLGLITNTRAFDFEISKMGCIQSAVYPALPKNAVLFQNVMAILPPLVDAHNQTDLLY